MPYRSTGRCPASASIFSNTGTGNGALPDTSSRAPDNAPAAPGSPQMRPHTVGTPKYIVPFAAAYAPGVGRTVWTSFDPVRSAPSVPRISPCTWKSGNPCTRVSSLVQPQASARPSRSAATARRESTAPFGRPVVPEVYITSAGPSPGSPPTPDATPDLAPSEPSIAIRGSVTSGQSGLPSTATAPESRSRCSRSIGPASAAMGTTGVPTDSAATTPTTVSIDAVAHRATAGSPAMRDPTVAARPAKASHEVISSPTRTASGWSPKRPWRAGSNIEPVCPTSGPSSIVGPCRCPRVVRPTLVVRRSAAAARRAPAESEWG